MKWMVSDREEGMYFDEEFSSKEEAIREGPSILQLSPGEVFYVGRVDETHVHDDDCFCEDRWDRLVVDIEEHVAPGGEDELRTAD